MRRGVYVASCVRGVVSLATIARWLDYSLDWLCVLEFALVEGLEALRCGQLAAAVLRAVCIPGVQAALRRDVCVAVCASGAPASAPALLVWASARAHGIRWQPALWFGLTAFACVVCAVSSFGSCAAACACRPCAALRACGSCADVQARRGCIDVRSLGGCVAACFVVSDAASTRAVCVLHLVLLGGVQRCLLFYIAHVPP